MTLTREQIATKAYITLLQSQGVEPQLIKTRTAILTQLSKHLAGKTLDGVGYRHVIEAYIAQIAPEDWPMHLSTAREYYHFWIEDIKAIASMHSAQAFDQNTVSWRPEKATLKSLTDRLKTEKFETSESWPLKGYQQALRDEGAEKPLVETRLNLVKIVLMRLRNAPVKNHQTYRTVVDSTVALFGVNNSRRLFLDVVREFYHFWSGNPEAANYVLKG